MSLHTGLLQAGVAGVVASYWAVSDDAAALLMVRFYDRWKAAGNPPADSPRQAQRWLRNTTNREKLAWLTAAADAGWLPRDAAAALADAVPGCDPDGHAFEHPARWAALHTPGPNLDWSGMPTRVRHQRRTRN